MSETARRWLELRRGPTLLLTALAAALVAARALDLLAAAWPFDTDDAYISLRYARHLVEGHGLTWNVGEHPPVEGYSNPLWVLLAAALMSAGADPLEGLKLLSVLGLAGACVAAFSLARRFVTPLAATVPALILVSFKGTALWTASGLETAAYQALLLGAVALVVAGLGHRPVDALSGEPRPRAAPSARALAGAGLLGFLAALARPEGAVVVAALGMLVLASLALRARAPAGEPAAVPRAAAVRAGAALALAFGLPYAAYLAWHVATFERLLPNSVLCKAAWEGGDPDQLTREFVAAAGPLLLVALVHPVRRLGLPHALLWALPLLYAAILHGADPIIAYEHRHFLAALAAVCVLAAVGGANAVRVMLLAALALGPVGRTVGEPLAAWADRYAERMAARGVLARWLAERAGPDDAVVIGDTGRVPFGLAAPVIDPFCLNNGEMTRDPALRDPAVFADRLLARRPAFVVVHASRPDRLVPRPEYGMYPAIVAHPAFAGTYAHRETFGAPGDDFFYWVFERADRAPAPPPGG